MLVKRVPTKAPILMKQVYQKIFPQVNKELAYWTNRANKIPNKELRTQALASIQDKKFHCQGGSVYSVLAGPYWKEAITFIVAYQTISDYLDNLCDRSTSLDPDDFRLLHQSMRDCFIEDAPIPNYYALREDQDDDDYLKDLVRTCQKIVKQVRHFNVIQPFLLELEELYSDLQVHKHVCHDERIPRLENWFYTYKEKWPMLSWYEFSACTGSTLGIFYLISYGLQHEITENLAKKIHTSYFPYMQGLHIMLDYFIDQEEDRLEGDLNFCNYYKDERELEERLTYFVNKTNEHIQELPDRPFHEMVQHGLVGLYLADPKVGKMEQAVKISKRLLRASGRKSQFFHWNIKLYNRLSGRY
jgi:tetraprenyl-beta-curcumene synthase